MAAMCDVERGSILQPAAQQLGRLQCTKYEIYVLRSRLAHPPAARDPGPCKINEPDRRPEDLNPGKCRGALG